jgi:Cof subfamily protein (haloacid dehalogenase superfamily)
VRFDTLAFDLDGTLLGRDERVSQRNVDALRRATDAGFRVILATARWFTLAAEVRDQLRDEGIVIDGPAVACSGAQVRGLANGVDLFDVRLPAECADELARVLDSVRCVAWAALDEHVAMKMDGPPRPDLPYGLRQTETLGNSLGGVRPRMVLVQGGDACARVEAELADRWSDRVRFVDSFSSSGKRILTITAQGADKGVALLAACSALGIDPRTVVAFGDAQNDIEMFAVAGASVAMGQASDAVKAAATVVSLPGNDDGVAVAIERLIDLGDAAFEGVRDLTA